MILVLHDGKGSDEAQRISALLAFLLWFAVGLSGRWIGFL